ncbi:hypothetical protein BYT27DRAFT_7179799, partial [Phlegmacium glaucopus]
SRVSDIFVALLAFTLVVNDIGEFLWGWPDFEFSVDNNPSKYLNINIDLVVAMPCGLLALLNRFKCRLERAMADRLFLSGRFRRNGVTSHRSEHSVALSASQAIAQSRNSLPVCSTGCSDENFFLFKPIISGTLAVTRVTTNLHITNLGYGYASFSYVDHKRSPHFPDIVQPLDNSFEATDKDFIACQYFLHMVPTTYISLRTNPLRTNQYSVTHYTREVQRDRGTPGIFFKFELDTLHITLHQRTTTFLHLLIRVGGVLGGVFVCMSYAIRITTRAVEVVSGADQAPGIAAESSGVKVGLRAKWVGSELRARPRSSKLVPQGSGWVMEGGSTSPYSSYNNTPLLTEFPSPGVQSPYINSATSAPSTPNPGTPDSVGLGYPSGIRTSTSLGPPPRTPCSASAGSVHSPLSPGPTQTLLTSDPNDVGVVVNTHSSASHSEYPASANPPNRN